MYMTWFQWREEPEVATEEYEQGTYVYYTLILAG